MASAFLRRKQERDAAIGKNRSFCLLCVSACGAAEK